MKRMRCTMDRRVRIDELPEERYRMYNKTTASLSKLEGGSLNLYLRNFLATRDNGDLG